ncbi:hypothetical protein DHEL01_v203934 [Diaporthe helianthi]|uniref:Uncharacterized protein n=1 Tax=Diaporthe helianthi TaxID=158607 RepID=A0A2P5I584_DIAHE|nr:hypothetical protein DHEL01_v203934 [Diaporthe helianthi]
MSLLNFPSSPRPSPPPEEEEENVIIGDLVRWIGLPSIDEDLAHINDGGQDSVPVEDQVRAERLAAAPQFRNWLTFPHSGHFLVNGMHDQASQISGLSLFCNSLYRALAGNKPRCIPLMFFCGLHTGPPFQPPIFADTKPQPGTCDDAPPTPNLDSLRAIETGGHVLVRSLI